MNHPTPRSIDVLLFEDANLLDIAGPVQAFSHAIRQDGSHAYTLQFVASSLEPVHVSCGLPVSPTALASGQSPASDLLIPGGRGVDSLLENKEVIALIEGWLENRPGGRLISICSGALALASAGVLDERNATTHWSRTDMAHRLFPKVEWDTDRLYVMGDPIYTSAGVSSGIDLALAMIRQDCGALTALAVARELVVSLQRSGGQNQFADLLAAQFSGDPAIAKLLGALSEHPDRRWSLDDMATFVGMTPRTLTRHFKRQMDTSPVRFVERLRVKRACDLMSAGMEAAQVLRLCGFVDAQQMHRAFKRQLGTTASAYQRRFGMQSAA